jgi:tripartite-type tricarboxylate transporter receptor subunit TctC
MSEAGVADFEITAWFGLMAPGGAPAALVQKISADVARVVAMPDVRNRILAQASEPISMTPKEYAEFIQSEIQKWNTVIKQANIQSE